MGKHERQDIEDMEKSVALCLLGRTPIIPEGHKWYPHMTGFVNYIRDRYPPCVDVVHLGNTYGDLTGDIKMTFENGPPRIIELKASESPHGKGTLGNISQNAITEYGLLRSRSGEEILSWQIFRKRRNFQAAIERLLDSYGPLGAFGLFARAERLKARAAAGDKRAIRIKGDIIDFANQDKRDYIEYLSKFESNGESIVKFLYCMLNGIRKKDTIRTFMAENTIGTILKKAGGLITLYANPRDSEIEITESLNPFGVLISDFERFSLSFPESSRHVICSHLIGFGKTCGSKATFLNLQLHWKNIFQGIKTPCINVFLGPYFQTRQKRGSQGNRK